MKGDSVPIYNQTLEDLVYIQNFKFKNIKNNIIAFIQESLLSLRAD
jgi:hypothetical protein